MINGRQLIFGVSGLLYRRNLVLYDVETGSLWSQLLSEAVAGPLAGKEMKVLPVEHSAWGVWKTRYPDTRVLSFATGGQRDYRQDPYSSYLISRKPALLVAAGEAVKIYPFSELKKGYSPLVDQVGDKEITIAYDGEMEIARVENQPAEVRVFVGYFDDLKDFYPHAQIYRRPRH